MVLDFGFLKEIMMQQCDALCDHGMVVWLDDPLLFMVVGESALRSSAEGIIRAGAPYHLVKEDRRFNQTKVLIVPFIPTAERLSQFWFNLMEAEVISLSDCMARLTKVEVWETPNCSAVFPAGTQ
jgi:6-pyruvoyltetrahydropterin/6-carboxytetrahydropterin synthase